MISVERVGKAYPPVRAGAKPTEAVRDVSLIVKEHEVVAIVGPSGCGKTTLLNMIAGFEKPTNGRITLDGREVVRPGRERVVVFQQPVLYPWLNVRDNVGFGLMFSEEKRSAEGKRRLDDFISIVGLEGFENHRPYQLSGGMQQRAAIARALIVEPKIVLMDEPLGALDAQTRAHMQAYLLELLARLQTTALLITHDIEEAILLADRVLVMTPRPGSIAATVPIPLGRPRAWDAVLTERVLELKRVIVQLMGGMASQNAEGNRTLVRTH